MRHGSKAIVRATNGARAFIECWNECDVEVFADEESRAFVYWHGGKVACEGSVIVRDKR